MGFFQNLFKPPAPTKKTPARTPSYTISVHAPNSSVLTFPIALTTAASIAENEHEDPRILFYAIRYLDRDTVFTASHFSDFEISDFETLDTLVDTLLQKELICPVPVAEALRKLYTVNELRDILRKRGLPVGGKKDELIERLLDSGFRGYTRRYKKMQYRLTESGYALIESEWSARREAISSAIRSLCDLKFYDAAIAYRKYDYKWGYIHRSGHNHTIFANYEFPQERFDFLANYPMRELANSDDFKRKLRACLIAGLMRGDQDRGSLSYDFQQVCSERIRCSRVVDLYKQGTDKEELEELKPMFEAMEMNCRNDSRYALGYYISHVLYLSRR